MYTRIISDNSNVYCFFFFRNLLNKQMKHIGIYQDLKLFSDDPMYVNLVVNAPQIQKIKVERSSIYHLWIMEAQRAI